MARPAATRPCAFDAAIFIGPSRDVPRVNVWICPVDEWGRHLGEVVAVRHELGNDLISCAQVVAEAVSPLNSSASTPLLSSHNGKQQSAIAEFGQARLSSHQRDLLSTAMHNMKLRQHEGLKIGSVVVSAHMMESSDEDWARG